MDHEARYEAALAGLAGRLDLAVESDYLQVDVPPVEQVHYLVAGEGPPILLLHGIGVGATSLLPLVADLAPDYTCYAIDRPGRGLSDPIDHTSVDFREFNADLLTAVLDELDVDSCPVVGNSFGGFQAMLFALDRPDRVTSITLPGAPAGLTSDYPWRLRLAGLPWIGPKLVAMVEPEDVEGAREVVGRVAGVDEDHLSEEYLEAYLAENDQPGQTESLASLYRDSQRLRGCHPDYVIRAEVPTIEQPTLFIWGRADQFFPPGLGRDVAVSMPNAQLVELDDAGHMPWLEQGDGTASAIWTFLSTEVPA